MTYLITEKCIKCKYTTCISVCPVDCFHEGKNMLVINPLYCINCGICVKECPIEAIIPDINLYKRIYINILNINKKYSKMWPNITHEKKKSYVTNKKKKEYNKFIKYFKENI